MRIIIAFSSGKDSHASLIWAVKTYGREKVEAVFCDTVWEHDLTYKHLKDVCSLLGVNLRIIKSKEFSGFVDMAIKKQRFPSSKARFCTEKLKSIPMIDYILDEVKESVFIVQGIRRDESFSRSKMDKQCTFFKYYFQPYGKDKKGKDKYFTYRKKEVIEWRKKYADDIIRPVFDFTSQEVINYILEAGHKPNPLYYKGMGRVGCMPCIMCTKGEVKNMVEHLPESAQRLIDAEKEMNNNARRSNFFGPGYIPARYCKQKFNKTITREDGTTYIKKVGIPTAQEVFNYVQRHASQKELFPDEKVNRSCMSAFNICE